MVAHIVLDGEGLTSIAVQYGFTPERVWNDPANESLRALRADPEILAPGDVLTIPEKKDRSAACATGKRHVFRRIGVPALFSLRLIDDGRAFANEAYELEIGERRFQGTTNDDGVLRHWVDPGARTAVLLVRGIVRIEIAIGAMEPEDSLAGVQKRLSNLGFACGDPDGILDDETRAAIAVFQQSRGLEPSGVADETTRAALRAAHDVQESQPKPR
jgi:N-acetylmuramoyl-L-alanine amidase